jgi:hypothetical protein
MAWRGPDKSVNQEPNPISHGPEMSDMIRTNNRAEQVRRDKDEVKNFSVTLADIDNTIFNYLDTVINPSVVTEGRTIKVPVIFSSQERWKSIKKDGYIRDKQGKVQCPVIAFRRTTTQRNDNLTTLNRYLQYPAVKRFSEKNQYDKFSLMSGFEPLQEVYSVALPDHVIINYDFIIWTELTTQGNSVIEKINFSSEDYWGDMKRFKFRTSIPDFNHQVEISADQDRVVKTTFSMMTYAYLLPDIYENYKSVVQKAFTQRKIVFDVELTGDSIKNINNQKKVSKTTKLGKDTVPDIDIIDPIPYKNRSRTIRPSNIEVTECSQAVFAGITSSYALDAKISDFAITASYATFHTGSFVVTASGVLSDETASYALTASYAEDVVADGGTF